MNHEEVSDFIRNLRTRLLNERHVIVERKGQEFPFKSHDRIEIEFYKDTPTDIPQVLIVWEDGETSKVAWDDITDVRYDGVKSIYKYCPILLSTITPANLQREHWELAKHHQVSTIFEE